MKTKVGLIIAVVASVIFTSCEKFGNSVVPSPTVTTESHSINDFDEIDISQAFSLEVRFGDRINVEIDANDNLHEHIIVERTGHTLKIKLKNRISIRRGDATLRAYVTLPNLYKLSASGASNIDIRETWISSEGSIDLSGASSLVGDVDLTDLFVDISGASNIDLSGVADYVQIDASGASDFRDYSLSTNWLNADLSGASDIYITVHEGLEIEASGASTLKFRGDGKIDRQDLSGASDIKRVN